MSGLEGLDSDLCTTTNSKPKLTRSQKRENRLKYARAEDTEESKHILDITSQQFRALQEADSTLEGIRRAAVGHHSTAGVGFFERDGLIIGGGWPQEEQITTLLSSS